MGRLTVVNLWGSELPLTKEGLFLALALGHDAWAADG